MVLSGSRSLARALLRTARSSRQVLSTLSFHIFETLFQERSLTHYPIDDRVNGLTEEQVQLRETVFNFCQKVVFQLFKMASGQNATTKRYKMTQSVNFSGTALP